MKALHLIATAFATVACAFPALAKTTTDSSGNTFLTGPYVGVFGGYDWTDIDFKPTGASVDPDGWEGGVFAGYKFDRLFGMDRNFLFSASAAIEGFYGVSRADETSAGTRVDKDNEWGVSFRPGLSVIDRIAGDTGLSPYAILGYRNTEFKSSGAVVSSERYDGFELGIGTELVAFNHGGLRLEYAHTWYGSQGGIDPASDDLRLGISLHF